jgi:hypothetical protein
MNTFNVYSSEIWCVGSAKSDCHPISNFIAFLSVIYSCSLAGVEPLMIDVFNGVVIPPDGNIITTLP